VPGGGFAGRSGVESGKAAPLVGGPPGIELHTVVEELPSGAVGEMFPIVVRTIGVAMVPRAAAGAIAAADMVGVNAVIGAAMLALGVDVEKSLMTVDDGGIAAAVTEDGAGSGSASRWGAGIVEPG
jgi:hypothetical protein